MDYDDEDGKKEKKVWKDFDCPECDANNPHDGFSVGDEVRCFYCGMLYKVKSNEDGKLRLIPD